MDNGRTPEEMYQVGAHEHCHRSLDSQQDDKKGKFARLAADFRADSLTSIWFHGILSSEPTSCKGSYLIMTIEQYRVRLGWSKAKLAREADIDAGTLSDAIAGKRIYKATAAKIAKALAKGLNEEITIEDLEGVNFID
jgi:DNA-binding XRE family transcriptional regulator